MNRMNNNDCRLFARPEILNQVALSFGHIDKTIRFHPNYAKLMMFEHYY